MHGARGRQGTSYTWSSLHTHGDLSRGRARRMGPEWALENMLRQPYQVTIITVEYVNLAKISKEIVKNMSISLQ